LFSPLNFGPALVALLFGYLLGSIPFGMVVTRAAGLGDVRKIGSGNIGATNVLRTGHRGLAAATLLLDAGKATIAVLLVQWAARQHLPLEETRLGYVAGVGALLGHIYPIWLRFRGGKGVATFIGMLLGADWQAAMLFCLVWLAVALLTRYSSLSALAATLSVTVFYLFMHAPVLLFIFPMAILIFANHYANISRLLAGTETKIGAQ
jgi:acyl phosphate:glycerol-3-phosphate acyltransferase